MVFERERERAVAKWLLRFIPRDVYLHPTRFQSAIGDSIGTGGSLHSHASIALKKAKQFSIKVVYRGYVDIFRGLLVSRVKC